MEDIKEVHLQIKSGKTVGKNCFDCLKELHLLQINLLDILIHLRHLEYIFYPLCYEKTLELMNRGSK